MSKVIRKKGNTHFLAVDETIEAFAGERFKNVFWVECDKDGNVADGNKDGIIQRHSILCKIPKGKIDIDISTLSDNCLNKVG